MIYFKHADLSDKYHVSLKTVHNWIDGAKQGKVNLKLHSVTNRTYVANTPENLLVLNDLADKGKKYRNTLHHKIVQPKPEFYEILSRRQILNLINNLNVNKELPKEYNYLKEGAQHWDDLLNYLRDNNTPSQLKSDVELLRANMSAINSLTGSSTRINIIDLGVGNASPLKEILENLIKRGQLHRYIGIDISSDMLKLAEKNLKSWFGEKFPFEGHVRDFSNERFDDLLVDDMLDDEANQTINLVFLLGGTAQNIRSFIDPMKITHDSLGDNGLFIFSAKVDTEASRRNLPDDHNESGVKLSPIYRYLPEMLGLDDSLYEVEKGFDKEQSMRYVRIRLKTSLTIRFHHKDIDREVVLERGEAILLHLIWHMTSLEIISKFENIGFSLLRSSLTEDRQYFLSISGVETKKIPEA